MVNQSCISSTGTALHCAAKTVIKSLVGNLQREKCFDSGSICSQEEGEKKKRLGR